jgi:exodeoxyribonuclease VII large subunit
MVRVQHLKQKLVQLTSHLKSIDPKNLLTKGYSILFRENSNSVIFSPKEVQAGENVRVLVKDGEIKAQVL